jgi:hypothetical protein
LRWDLVFQRPQHLMTRFARSMPVFFIEEPAFEGREPPHLKRYTAAENLSIIVPRLPQDLAAGATVAAQRRLIGDLLREARIYSPLLWYYTPMALQFADTIDAAVTVYDCMDELSAFQDASPELRRLEGDLLGRVDIVFTGGMSHYEEIYVCISAGNSVRQLWDPSAIMVASRPVRRQNSGISGC